MEKELGIRPVVGPWVEGPGGRFPLNVIKHFNIKSCQLTQRDGFSRVIWMRGQLWALQCTFKNKELNIFWSTEEFPESLEERGKINLISQSSPKTPHWVIINLSVATTVPGAVPGAL